MDEEKTIVLSADQIENCDDAKVQEVADINELIHVIIAPHVDDEVIGCYDILNNPKNKCIIVYSDFDITAKRANEMLAVKNEFENIMMFYRAREIPQMMLDGKHLLHFPDPHFETHPDHKLIGNKGMELFHKGLPIFFYSVNMEAPYIYKVKDPGDKQGKMNMLFQSQKEMWAYEAKYYLFEGHCQYAPASVWR